MKDGILGKHLPLVLSPMVDVTDGAFRSIAIEQGADVTCSEMVSATGLLHDSETAWWHVKPWPYEHPYGVQFMCGNPTEMGDAVRKLATKVRPEFVDVNLGCPAPNILRSMAGGFLLRDPTKAGQVIRAAKEAADELGIKHISAKMRLGPSVSKQTFLQVGEEAEAAGASWVTLHGRTVDQGYAGSAHWPSIAKLVDHLGIPVIGNGDLRTPEDVLRMRMETNCAGFFIARAAMIDPTIFRRMRAALAGQPYAAEPSLKERIALFLDYMERAETIGLNDIGPMRRQAARFVAGASGAKRVRIEVQLAPDAVALRERLAVLVATLP